MQDNAKLWEQIIHSSSDLVTTHQATRDGFLQQALKKTEKATLYVQTAQELLTAMQAVEEVNKLLDLPAFREGLIAAAGFSDKATNHLSKDELNNAVSQVFHRLYDQCKVTFGAEGEEKVRFAFHQEILYRNLITNGGSLGGEMNNWVGANASQKLAAALLGALQQHGTQVEDINKSEKTEKIRRISWPGRLLLFDVTPTLSCTGGNYSLKNIDIILINTKVTHMTGKKLEKDPDRYLACGELKGGIDPAGADEHWKTATTAFSRIREGFTRCGKPIPQLFFVGAAIANFMATEIYMGLGNGELSYAANLTVPEQLSSLAQWLVNL